MEVILVEKMIEGRMEGGWQEGWKREGYRDVTRSQFPGIVLNSGKFSNLPRKCPGSLEDMAWRQISKYNREYYLHLVLFLAHSA